MGAVSGASQPLLARYIAPAGYGQPPRAPSRASPPPSSSAYADGADGGASSWAPLERACLEPLSAGGAAARAVLDAARQESLELAALGTALDEQQRQYEISRGQIAAVYQVAPSAGTAAASAIAAAAANAAAALTTRAAQAAAQAAGVGLAAAAARAAGYGSVERRPERVRRPSHAPSPQPAYPPPPGSRLPPGTAASRGSPDGQGWREEDFEMMPSFSLLEPQEPSPTHPGPVAITAARVPPAAASALQRCSNLAAEIRRSRG
jgi:hypothetical protein